MDELTLTQAEPPVDRCMALALHDRVAYADGVCRGVVTRTRVHAPLPRTLARPGSDPDGVFAGSSDVALPAPTDRLANGEKAVAAWRAVEGSVAPILGVRGVSALYERSLTCARRVYPWLPEGRSGPIELASLFDAMAGRPASEASRADALLRQSFRALLASLVGPRLAHRLLRRSSQAGSEGHPRIKSSE